MFEEIVEKDAVSWNTMIIGYSRHSFSKQALSQFESMKETGIRLVDVTMVNVDIFLIIQGYCKIASLMNPFKTTLSLIANAIVRKDCFHTLCLSDVFFIISC